MHFLSSISHQRRPINMIYQTIRNTLHRTLLSLRYWIVWKKSGFKAEQRQDHYHGSRKTSTAGHRRRLSVATATGSVLLTSSGIPRHSLRLEAFKKAVDLSNSQHRRRPSNMTSYQTIRNTVHRIY